MSILVGPTTLSATGGVISKLTGFTVHTFSTPGAATFTPSGSGIIEVLVVGGGGGAGNNGIGNRIGGGGGGAVVYNKFVNVTSGTPYPITVSSGGALSVNGGNSSCTFNNVTIIAYGGGAGAPGFPGAAPGASSSYASGGGGGEGSPAGVGAGITGLGFPGGIYPLGGSGGGASSKGVDGGNGGIGVSYSITGISSYYGGGGAGAPGYTGNSSPNGGLPGVSYGTGGSAQIAATGTPGAVIIRYPS